MSLKTLHHQSAQLLVDGARHHSNRMRRCTGFRSKCHNDWWEHKFRSLSHEPKVMLDACAQTTQWIARNGETGTVTAALKIVLSSRFTMGFNRPLQFWPWYMLLFTHLCHCLITASFFDRLFDLINQPLLIRPKDPFEIPAFVCSVKESFCEALLQPT